MNKLDQQTKINGTLLAIMTVEISADKSDIIYIYDKDDPRDLAILFASKHDLPGRYLLKLLDNIKLHKQQAQQTVVNDSKQTHQKSNYFRNSVNSTPYKQQSTQVSQQTGLRKSTILSGRSQQRDLSQDGSRIIRDLSSKEIKSKEQNQLSFTPTINKHSQMIIKNKQQDDSVEQRLINYGKTKEIKLQELRMQKQQALETQNRSFTHYPKTSQRSHEILAEKSNRNSSYKDIFNKSPENNSFVINIPCPDQTLVQQVWKAALKKLFSQMDKQQCGQLSADQVDLSQLSYEMLQIVAPVLLILEERGGYCKFEEFAKEVTNYCVKHNFVDNLFSLLL